MKNDKEKTFKKEWRIYKKEWGTMVGFLIAKWNSYPDVHFSKDDVLMADDRDLLAWMAWSYGPRHFRLWRQTYINYS